MRVRSLVFFACIIAVASGVAATPKDHIMLGPYEYEENGRKVPRFFLIDDVRCRTQAELKQAAANLPAGSYLVWSRSDASPPSVIELGFPPMTIPGFENFCSHHHVHFSAIVHR